MEDFKILTEDELAALSNKERREYLKQKREYDNKKLVTETANQEVEVVPAATPSETITITEPAPVPKKKSNAGRKAIDDADKKQQIMLTIEAESKLKLEGVDKKNFKKLLGRYIDKNIDEIVEAIEKL